MNIIYFKKSGLSWLLWIWRVLELLNAGPHLVKRLPPLSLFLSLSFSLPSLSCSVSSIFLAEKYFIFEFWKTGGMVLSHRLFPIGKMFNECLVGPRHSPEIKADTKINEHRVCPQGVSVLEKSLDSYPIIQQMFIKCLPHAKHVLNIRDIARNEVKALPLCSWKPEGRRLTTKK